MIRFQRLSKEELEYLEPQFINFLAAQSIVAEDWQKIVQDDPNRADALIDEFSNVVYGTVMRKAQFLEKRTKHVLYSYQCHEDRFELVAFRLDENSGVDLRTDGPEKYEDLDAEIFTADKAYEKDRADEIYAMMQLGCEITDGQMFNVLKALL